MILVLLLTVLFASGSYAGIAVPGSDAALRAAGDAAVSNYVNSVADGTTNYVNSVADGITNYFSSVEGGTTNYVGTLIETAWQNPAAATNWTWTSNGREITLTGYSGTNAVVIPDMLDGLPVTGFGEVFRGNKDITSVGGGANIKAVDDYAFFGCDALDSVSLPACTTVGDSAFYGCVNLSSVSLPACTTVGTGAFLGCGSLNSVSLPACTTVGESAFDTCVILNSVSLPACTTLGNHAFDTCWALNSVSLPACTTVGARAFYACHALNPVSLPACTTVGVDAFRACGNLSSVTFGQNAPAPAADVFKDSTPTIYVSNPHATGWGDTWNGRPVVRAASMPDIASHNTNGTAHADIRALIPTADGITNYVNSHAQVVADTNVLGHVTNVSVSYTNNLLYFIGTPGCTGVVFQFYTPGGVVTNVLVGGGL